MTKLAYQVQTRGVAPHYAEKDQREPGVYMFDNVWKALWLGIGCSDKATVKVGFTRTEGDKEPKFEAVGSTTIPAAKEIFPDRVNDSGAIVKD